MQLVIQFRPKEAGNHRSIQIWNDDGVSLIFTPNSDFFRDAFKRSWMSYELVFSPNSTILFVDVPIYPKMDLIAEDNFR